MLIPASAPGKDAGGNLLYAGPEPSPLLSSN